MRRRLVDWLGYVRDRGYLVVGPLVVTTRGRHAGRERNSFEIGRDIGRAER